MNDPEQLNSENTPKSVEQPFVGEILIDYPDSYRERMGITALEIEGAEKSEKYVVNIGPRYNLSTSKGEPIMVDSLYVDYIQRSGLPARKYYLVAQDINGQIVGDRTTLASQFDINGDKYASAEGMTATGKRGAGIVTVIETVHQDILQREATRLNQRVVWYISNANNEVLADFKDNYKINPSDDLALEIKNKEEEQVAWQKVYGVGGKMGFDETGRKAFLASDLEEKYHTSEITVTSLPKDKDLYSRARGETVDRVIERMKKVSGK